MSDKPEETRTPEEDGSVDEKPTNTKLLDANNDTILEIENDNITQKSTEVQKLKQAVYADLDLHNINVITDEAKGPHSPELVKVEFGGDRYSNRPVWVQFIQKPTGSGVPMEENSRGPFVRKVFLILFFCLLFTGTFACFSFVLPEIRLFFRTPGGLILTICSLVVLIPVVYAMSCSDCTRVPPCNWICLIIVVICFTIFFGFITAQYDLKIVFMALFVTTLVVLLCFILAFTSFDFTKFYLYVIVFFFVLFAFSIVVSIMAFALNQKFTIARLAICCGMTLIHSMFLVMEIQMVLGGKTIEIGEDDYILGAFMLYTSIMNLFFELLKLLGHLQDLDLF